MSVTADGNFFGYELQELQSRVTNVYVTTRDFAAIRNEAVIAAKNFIEDRIESNDIQSLFNIKCSVCRQRRISLKLWQ